MRLIRVALVLALVAAGCAVDVANYGRIRFALFKSLLTEKEMACIESTRTHVEKGDD